MSNDTYSDVVGQRGEYRAKITIDTSPHEPEYEMGYPVLRIDSDGYRVRVDPTGYGDGSAKADGLTSWTADEALAHCIRQQGNPTDGVEMFSRWLRIWHGGSAVGYHLGYSPEYGYCAYVTEAMVRNGWGGTGPVPEPELSEWEAYCEGDVYIVAVERRLLKRTEFVTTDDTHFPVEAFEQESWWEEPDSAVGGYYGEDYAREAALEALDTYAPKDGAA